MAALVTPSQADTVQNYIENFLKKTSFSLSIYFDIH